MYDCLIGPAGFIYMEEATGRAYFACVSNLSTLFGIKAGMVGDDKSLLTLSYRILFLRKTGSQRITILLKWNDQSDDAFDIRACILVPILGTRNRSESWMILNNMNAKFLCGLSSHTSFFPSLLHQAFGTSNINTHPPFTCHYFR